MNCKYQTYKTILRHVHNFISGWFLNHDLCPVIIHNFFVATMTIVFPFSSFSPILGPEEGRGFFSPLFIVIGAVFLANSSVLTRNLSNVRSTRTTLFSMQIIEAQAEQITSKRNTRNHAILYEICGCLLCIGRFFLFFFFYRNQVIRGRRWR